MMIGDARVGKTCLAKAFMGEAFDENEEPSAQMTCAVKQAKSENHCEFELRIHDISGKKQFQPVAMNMSSGMDGFVVCFDLTKEETLEAALDLTCELISRCFEHKNIIVVGTKADLEDQRQISQEDAKLAVAECFGSLHYMELSAKDGSGVQEALGKIIELVCQYKF